MHVGEHILAHLSTCRSHFLTGLPCSLLPPMYMSSFLTSSPVTWSKVRPSEETVAYLAPSYRRTSKLTPSYWEGREIRHGYTL